MVASRTAPVFARSSQIGARSPVTTPSTMPSGAKPPHLLSHLVTPPRLHKHRYCGVLAPNAALRSAVTASAGPAGATLQLLERARREMGLPEPQAESPAEPDQPSPLTSLRRAAARCWALLLVRIYECLPLRCPKCGEPMRT